MNDITAVVGENNAGKTAVLRAINAVLNYNFEESSFISKKHQYAPRNNTYIVITFSEIPTKPVYSDKLYDRALTIKFSFSYSDNKKRYVIVKGREEMVIDDHFLEELSKDINLNLGGFTADITAIAKDGTRDEFTPLLIVRSKALHSKLADLCRIVNEIISESRFTNVKRLTELVQESKAIWDNEAFRRGHTIVTQRVLAQVSGAGKFRDSGNLGYYQKISELATNPAALPLLPEKLAEVAKKIFRSNNLDIMFVGEEEELAPFIDMITPIISNWSHDVVPGNKLVMTKQATNEAIVTAGKVQYVAQGGNFKDHGFDHKGAMSVLEVILRYEYLWIRIRVQGGAYGAFANFYNDGSMVFCSYRDPNLTETLDVYKELPEYLRNFNLTDREMRKYIIGTMSSLDLTMTPSLRGPRAMGLYFSGTNLADKVEFRKQVIACQPQDIVALADVVESVIKDNHICAMGNEEKIKAAGSTFDEIVSLPN